MILHYGEMKGEEIGVYGESPGLRTGVTYKNISRREMNPEPLIVTVNHHTTGYPTHTSVCNQGGYLQVYEG